MTILFKGPLKSRNPTHPTPRKIVKNTRTVFGNFWSPWSAGLNEFPTEGCIQAITPQIEVSDIIHLGG